MRAESYRLVVASILYSEQDKRVGCRPYELLEYLRQAVKYGDEEHNAIVFEVEHLTRFAIELRLSCETAHNFFVVLQQEGSDERRFRAEHYLEANPPENYVLDLGESTRRSLTICRVDDEGSSRTVSFSSDTALPGNTLTSHKIHKSNSFLKRLRRKCSGSVYQILLSHCRLNAWNQHSLSTIVPNSVITFRILRISKGLPCHDMIIKSEEIANDFCELTKCIAETDAELQCERSQSREYDGGLGDAGDAILDHSIKFSGLPHIYRRLIILCVLLEWSHKEISLSERAIPLAITQLRTSSHLDVDLCSPMSARFSLAAKRFIKNTLHFDHTVKFFPPIQHSPVANFTRRIELAVSIRNLELWRHFPLQSPVDTFRCELQGIIEVEVNSWVKQCESDLPNAVRSLTNSLSFFSDSYISLFGYFDISYIGVVFATLDQKLSKKGTRFVRRALRSLDTHNDESLESFTKATMKLFEGFKNLVKVAKEARVKDGELFSYESWFTASAVFWTFTWRTMCRRLTLRSLAEDNEGICDERVLPSVVNFLAIHKALCEDFIHLELQNANLALMCVFKIALTIADDLLIYSKRMHAASGSFDSTKRMLAANSIEHACNFVKNSTARLLNVDTLSAVLPPNEFRQANASISQILSNAVEQCKGLAISIVTALCKERCEAVAKYCHAITQYAVKGRKNLGWLRAVLSAESTDHLLAYLDQFCSQISSTLFPRLSENARHQLLEISENSILESLLKGQPPSYYRQIQISCEMIRRVIRVGSAAASSQLNNALYLNSFTSEQLILQYYVQLADRTENFAAQMSSTNLRLRVGYLPTTNQQITVQIDVMSAFNLPVLDRLTNSSDAYCRVEVLPRFLFPISQFRAQKTAIKKQTLNPIWDEQFQLTVSEESFYTNGSVLCLSVVGHERLAYNDLVGQAYIQLSRIPRILSFSSKHRAAIISSALLLPSSEQFVGPFQVLVERSAKDEIAREMCDYEMYLVDYHMIPPYVDNANVSALRRRRTLRKFVNARRRRETVIVPNSRTSLL